MMMMIKFCDLPTRRASSALLLATSISSNVFVIWGIRPLLYEFFKKALLQNVNVGKIIHITNAIKKTSIGHRFPLFLQTKLIKLYRHPSDLSRQLIDQSQLSITADHTKIKKKGWNNKKAGTSSSCPNITAALPILVQALASPGWQKIYNLPSRHYRSITQQCALPSLTDGAIATLPSPSPEVVLPVLPPPRPLLVAQARCSRQHCRKMLLKKGNYVSKYLWKKYPSISCVSATSGNVQQYPLL